YRRRDRILGGERVRDGHLRSAQGDVLHPRRNRQRIHRDRLAADGGQGGVGDLRRSLDRDPQRHPRPRTPEIRRGYVPTPDDRRRGYVPTREDRRPEPASWDLPRGTDNATRDTRPRRASSTTRASSPPRTAQCPSAPAYE